MIRRGGLALTFSTPRGWNDNETPKTDNEAKRAQVWWLWLKIGGRGTAEQLCADFDEALPSQIINGGDI